jgi:very-short-patch-repair endonuclease
MNRQLGNFKFRRQHTFPPYMVDLVCLEKKLIVEIDGGQHMAVRNSDELRTRFLETQGFKVIRFWNHEVLQNTDAVLNQILSYLNSMD